MNQTSIIILLIFLCLSLVGYILYDHFFIHKKKKSELQQICFKLKEILDDSQDEQLLLFTDNKDFQLLLAQINRLLDSNLKVKAEYQHTQMASKKMLANISHDLKTPMTVVLGYLEIMTLEENYSKEMLQKTQEKAQEVITLINQFFTLAKIEAGDNQLNFSRLDIVEICRESLLDFYTILTAQNFEVDLDIPEHPILINGDTEAIQRILFNLISNAIRYGADGHYLSFKLEEYASEIVIHVKDKGKGIDPVFAEHVFDRLFTMEDSRNRKIQGNGLGLTIAQNLAKQHGGKISLTSIPNIETIFSVSLPKVNY